eukprot:scaffold73757_cov49-Phaeocystis_antarctica.AAC.2
MTSPSLRLRVLRANCERAAVTTCGCCACGRGPSRESPASAERRQHTPITVHRSPSDRRPTWRRGAREP